MKRLFTLLLAGCIGAAASTQAQAQVPIFKNATKIAECLTKAGVSSLLTNGNQAFDKRFSQRATPVRPYTLPARPQTGCSPIRTLNVAGRNANSKPSLPPGLHERKPLPGPRLPKPQPLNR